MVKGKRDVDKIEFLTYHWIGLFKPFTKISCQSLDAYMEGQLPTVTYYCKFCIFQNILSYNLKIIVLLNIVYQIKIEPTYVN